MKRTWVLLLLFSIIFFFACATKEKSALEKLTGGKNPIDSMRFPERSGKNKLLTSQKQNPTIEITTGSLDPKDSDSPRDEGTKIINEKQISQIPDQPPAKWVTISGNNVPLRKGPGGQYKKIGIAFKGDTFRLLRIQRSFKDNQAWYFVEKDNHEKFFVSNMVSEISVEEKKEPPEKREPEKEIIHKRKNYRTVKARTVFDPTPPLPKSLREAKHITLNFEGTELYDVITTFCELLQIDYLIEGNIKGKVTLQTFNKIPVRDLYIVLEQILALHNITVVKSGNFYRFLPIKEAKQKPLNIFYGNDPLIPAKERMIIEIIPLEHISLGSMKKILAPLVTPNASFIDVPETKNLMLVEMASNVKRILKVVETLDIDKLASSDIQLFKMNNADANTVVEELKEIFSSMGYSEALDDSLTFLPLKRLNSILVVNAFESILSNIEFWIKKLDQPISEGEVSTFVYYVQNADAPQMATILSSVFQSSEESLGLPQQGQPNPSNKPPASSGAPISPGTPSGSKLKKVGAKTQTKPKVISEDSISQNLQGEMTIIPDEDTNSLIIRTNPRNYPALLSLIKKLDLLPQQVLIEVLIIDLVLDAETRTGLEWALQKKTGDLTIAGGVSQTPGTGGTTLGSAIGSATATFLPGGSLFVGEPNDLRFLLQAFARDSKANVLANPILVTSDNKAANISIADEIPIESTVISTPTAGQPLTQSTIEFRSVGIKLDIEPKINSDNFVNLKISQEISSVGPTVGTTPSFSTRNLNTEIVLKDNQVLVMGGLMRTDTSEANEGIPFLRKIPIFGKLFSTDTESTNKTELMIFITPHIISNAEDSDFVTKQFQRRLGNLKAYQDNS